MSLLLKNASIIGPGFTCLENAYLGIDNSVIDYLGSERPSKIYTEEKDMSSKLLLPGLINVHSHAPMVLLRGIGSNLPLQEWLQGMFAIEDRLQPEDYKVGVELALLEMLACGTTGFSDMYMREDVIAEVVGKSGMKANLCRCFCGGFNDEDYGTSFRRAEAFGLYENYNDSFSGRIKVDFSIHAEYTTTEKFIRKFVEEVKDVRGARMHIHLSETKKEHEECLAKYGKTPAKLFCDCGLFDIPTQAAHCVWVSDEDIALMKEKKVSVCHNPESNLKLGSGIAPIRKFLDNGLVVGLGTDGAASNNNLNMMEEMHTLSIIHKGCEKDPMLISAEQCLAISTLNGAKIQGREDTGILEVGKKADIIALDLDKPHFLPNLDTLALVTYSAQASDVCMTMVDGKILYENGEYKTLDKDRIYYETKQSVERLYR